ncbi:MAG: hypothetical protein AAGH15_04830 [Myxococcota bacterium]
MTGARAAMGLLALSVACSASEEPGAFVAASAREACAPLTLDEGPAPRWVDVPGAAPAELFVAGAQRAVAGELAAPRRASAGVTRRFRPAFPLTPGLTYEVRRASCRASFRVPPLDGPAPQVLAVHPRSALLPENVLRFYVTFSEPMADALTQDPIRLRRVSGEDLSGVFFRPSEALWSADRRRLTLLVDPGRVKTGLRAHRTLGRAFVAGERYRLEVRAGWPSLAGATLEAPFVHHFRAAPEDRTRVDPERWCLRTTEGPTGPQLRVHFREPVDHGSVGRLLQLAHGRRIAPGTWTLEAGDARATWVPSEALAAPLREHRLLVDARFEDVAGNDIRAAFDHVVGEGSAAPGLVERPLDGVAADGEACDGWTHEPRR